MNSRLYSFPVLGLENSTSGPNSKDPPHPQRAEKEQKNQANAATAADADPASAVPGTSAVFYKVSSKEKKYGKRVRRTAGGLAEGL